VRVQQIELEEFRNLARQTLEPGPRFNVLSGDNAQGKTNFLEAVHLVASLRPLSAGRMADLIGFGKPQARVRATVQSLSGRRELELLLRPGGRVARCDGKAVRSNASYLDGLSVVVFTPEDLWMPRGSPAGRRRLLDRSIGSVWPAYLSLTRDYQRVLQSRNHVLRQPGPDSDRLLSVYDGQLSELGARIVAGRLRYLDSIDAQLSETFQQIVRSGAQLELVYRRPEEVQQAGDRIDDLGPALLSLIRRSRRRDLARGSSSVGPHADDLEFRLDGRSTRSFGSQGQLRSVVLALKITQISNIYQQLKFYPLLLLDDVSSELDDRRRDYLFEFISEISCQTFLTTTRRDLIRLAKDRVDFQVVKGQILQQI
jgi:DNA replication and repair protein RecF